MKTRETTLEIRWVNDRACADHDWLKSPHRFSFAEYYDPVHVAFYSARVISEDRVTPVQGFGTHPHGDMETGDSANTQEPATLKLVASQPAEALLFDRA